MKKTLKIISALLIAIFIISVSLNVFAVTEQIEPKSIQPDYRGDVTGMQNIAKRVAALIRNIAVVASVIILMILGVKYMMGSVEEKADYKKSFIPYIVGIIVVLSASTIASFIFNIIE